MNGNPVHLVTALPAEAAPVTSRFDLKRRQPDCGFPVYRNRHISLVVSGVGKTNAAAASASLHALNHCPANAIWINLGIAGHGKLPRGEAVLAHSITDAATGETWRPPVHILPPCTHVGLETLDRPDFDYERRSAFDMEASGFYATAVRLSPPQLVHCFKVISDNREQSGRGISAALVRRLIADRLDLLQELLDRLTTIAGRLHPGGET